MRMTIKDLSHRDSFDFATVKKDMFLLVGARDPCDAASTAVCDADRGLFFFSMCTALVVRGCASRRCGALVDAPTHVP